MVTGQCGDPSVYDELVVGAEIGPGTQGGGIVGIDVTYKAKGHQHVVTLPDILLVCGPAAVPYDAKHSCSN